MEQQLRERTAELEAKAEEAKSAVAGAKNEFSEAWGTTAPMQPVRTGAALLRSLIVPMSFRPAIPRQVAEKTGRKVLWGQDPTIVTVDDTQFEIAWFAVGNSGLQVFVRAGKPLSLTSARALLDRLSLNLPVKLLRIVIRNDYRFIAERDFPLIYPFAPDDSGPPPADSRIGIRQIEFTSSRRERRSVPPPD